jgi:predicted membrane channel-forming protein YqfA (hemolysin III family)
MLSRLGNWFFLIGSLLFTFDALLNWLADGSAQRFILLSGCLLFTIGCILFILDVPERVKLRR